MQSGNTNIDSKINAFKRKYYLSIAIKGTLIALGLILSIYLIVNTLEYSFRFGSLARAGLLIGFVIAAGFAMLKYVARPLYQLLHGAMDDEEAARKIGTFYPDISDRLLNVIQLQKLKFSSESLKEASIQQKAQAVSTYEFANAVDISENSKYLKYLLIPGAFIAIILLISPSFLTTSTERIIKFNRDFVPQAPFSFHLENEQLTAFKNEDFTINLTLTGNVLPENAYIVDDSRKIKMAQTGLGQFKFTFKKIQETKTLEFQAAGYTSQTYTIDVVSRPDLRNFNVYLDYPHYLGKKDDVLHNVGNLQIPEGTVVKWQLKTLEAQEAAISFSQTDKRYELQPAGDQMFEFEKKVKSSAHYNIHLNNQHSANKEKITYKIDVVRDDYPQINLNVFQDTTLYSYVALGGSIADDYGLTSLKLYYRIDDDTEGEAKSIDIPITRGQTSQRYYYQWMIDSLNIGEGSELRYWLRVWDNDAVNGRKSSKTGVYRLKVPSKKEIREELDKKTEETESDINEQLKKAKALKEKIEEAERKLRGKKELNWQDQNLLKDIINKKKELNEAIEKLKEENRTLNTKRERFNKQNDNLQQKVEQLQKLMDDLLDEETRKLYEELKKLLEENKDLDQIQDALKQMNKREENLEKELERTLELFKRMKFEQELSETIEQLEEQAEKQEALMKETAGEKEPAEEKEDTEAANESTEQEDTQEQNKEQQSTENEGEQNTSKSKKEDLVEKQEELNEEFSELEEKIEELKEQNQELKNPKSMPDTREEQEAIKQNQQQSTEQLRKGQKNKAKKSQQKAKQKMQEMKEKMEQMQQSMQLNMMQENLDDLRDIVHNLIKLSFDQEDLMNEFTEVKQSDPRFIELAQKQLDLKDDAKIVEDSLMSLAKRVFQISSFVTREVTAMNTHMDRSVEAIRERKKPKAVAEQQFAMTSMNNLALLLDDVLKQMQQAMSDAMGRPQKGEKEDGMSLSKMQEQLNQQINELKKSGKTGRELSEELAKLAAQQERIRKALQEMQEKSTMEDGQKPGQGIPEKMEETEADLVNKRITDETIKRQQEILTRLLEAENAMRERELDEERKGETAKDYEKALPRVFEEYFKLKEKEIELLKTVPPKLYPYYKKEVNEYFKRIESGSDN